MKTMHMPTCVRCRLHGIALNMQKNVRPHSRQWLRQTGSALLEDYRVAELDSATPAHRLRSKNRNSSSARAQEGSAWDNLAAWIEQLGGTASKVELGQTYLDGFPVRGLILKQDVSEGEVVMSVPLGAGFIDNKIDPAYPGAPWNVSLAAFLLKEKSKGAASQWAPYLALLPTTQGSPLYFSSGAHAALQYEPAMLALLSFKACVIEGWEQLSKLGEPAFSSMEEFAWAMLMVHSRALRLAMLGIRAMLPGIDLLNHGGPLCNGHLGLGRQVWALEGSSTVNFIADKSLQQGEQVLWTYGDRSNDDFFLYHGFVVDNNPHDSVILFNSVDHVVRWYTSMDPKKVPDRAHMAALIFAASQASEAAAAQADQAPAQQRRSSVPSTVVVSIMQQVMDEDDDDAEEHDEAPSSSRSWWRHELGGQPWWQWGMEKPEDDDLLPWPMPERSARGEKSSRSRGLSYWHDERPARHAHGHRRRPGSSDSTPSASTSTYTSPTSSMWFGPGMSGSHSAYEEPKSSRTRWTSTKPAPATPSNPDDEEPAVVLRIEGPSPDGSTKKREIRRQWSIYTEDAVRVQGSFRLHMCDWGVPGDRNSLTGAHPMPEMLVQAGGLLDVRLLACLQFLQHAWGVPRRLQRFVRSELGAVGQGGSGEVLFGQSGAADLAWCGAVWVRCEELLRLMPTSLAADQELLIEMKQEEERAKQAGEQVSPEQQQRMLALRYRMSKKHALQRVAGACRQALMVC